jgi:hypothetical protein
MSKAGRLMTIDEVTRHPLVLKPDGSPLCYGSVWKWVARGIKLPGGGRAVLESVRGGGVGRTSFVTEAALKRFLALVREAYSRPATCR